jgi:hypothetical protein
LGPAQEKHRTGIVESLFILLSMVINHWFVPGFVSDDPANGAHCCFQEIKRLQMPGRKKPAL